MLEKCCAWAVWIVTALYSFSSFCRGENRVNFQRLLCIRSREKTPLIVSAETSVTGVSGLPAKLCTTQKCTSEMTFQFSFRECMASAQLIRVCSQFCVYNACYLIYFLFVVVLILLLTLIGKIFLVKQWSKTQPRGIVFLQDFCLKMVLSPSMYYDNSYVKLSQKCQVLLIFSGNTLSWGTAM